MPIDADGDVALDHQARRVRVCSGVLQLQVQVILHETVERHGVVFLGKGGDLLRVKPAVFRPATEIRRAEFIP